MEIEANHLKWAFPEMGVPLNHVFLVGYPLFLTIQLLGYPHVWKPPNGLVPAIFSSSCQLHKTRFQLVQANVLRSSWRVARCSKDLGANIWFNNGQEWLIMVNNGQ